MVKNRKSCDVPDATINRLPLYLEKLKLLQAIGVEDVSSRQLAESLDMPLNDVYGVASFYSFISLKPLGRNIIRI